MTELLNYDLKLFFFADDMLSTLCVQSYNYFLEFEKS